VSGEKDECHILRVNTRITWQGLSCDVENMLNQKCRRMH